MTKEQVLQRRDQRRNFSIDNGILDLVGKKLLYKQTVALLNRLGIEVFMFIDSDCDESFFELTGLYLEGRHDESLNDMVFEIKDYS